MSNKKKKTKEKTKVSKAKSLEEAQELMEEEYNSNLIYNFFNFFIGGPNKAGIKNKQTGKPTPPY
jgi:hypothetical protein